jgi:uncharacterized protein with NRDE domain
MCLLAVLSNVHPEWPLVIAANRDELPRPALVATVLAEAGPRILGGRDLVAGGTWLAVNQHGVVAALTNLASRERTRDATRRSRGELPLMLARGPRAVDGVVPFAATVRPADYNPCWLLVADREALFYLDLTAGGSPAMRELQTGVHVLENQPLDTPSIKAAWTRAALGDIRALGEAALIAHLGAVLRSHEVPALDGASPAELARPRETLAACVHAGIYATRSSTIVLVPHRGLPRMLVSDGSPCQAPYQDISPLWSAPKPEASGV